MLFMVPCLVSKGIIQLHCVESAIKTYQHQPPRYSSVKTKLIVHVVYTRVTVAALSITTQWSFSAACIVMVTSDDILWLCCHVIFCIIFLTHSCDLATH